MRIRPLCSDPCRGELLTDRAALGQGCSRTELLTDRAALGQGCSRTELLTDRAALGQTFRPAQGRVQNLPVFSGAQWPPCPGTETDAHCFGPVRPSWQVSLSRSGTGFVERRGCATLSGDRDRCAQLQRVFSRAMVSPALGEIRNGQRPWRAARALDPACECLLGDRVQAPSGEEGKFLALPAGQGASGGVEEQVADQVVLDEVGHPPSEEWPPNRGSAMPRLAAH